MIEKRALEFSSIHEHRFPFCPCGIGDFPSVASVAQTNDSPLGKVTTGVYCRMDGSEVPSQTAATPPVPDMRWVVLHCQLLRTIF
jgi:hypothetical protein